MNRQRQQRLEEMELQLAAQDQAWEQTKHAIARLGQAPLAVPQEALDEIASATKPVTSAPILGVRA
jgi:hypothetical protein